MVVATARTLEQDHTPEVDKLILSSETAADSPSKLAERIQARLEKMVEDLPDGDQKDGYKLGD